MAKAVSIIFGAVAGLSFLWMCFELFVALKERLPGRGLPNQFGEIHLTENDLTPRGQTHLGRLEFAGGLLMVCAWTAGIAWLVSGGAR